MECDVGLVEGGWFVSLLLGLVLGLGRDRRCGLCGLETVVPSLFVLMGQFYPGLHGDGES